MKKIFILSFFFLFGFSVYSQVYKAGDTLPIYIDINPDTLINSYCTSSSGNITEDYFFDINGDSQNDFKIEAHCSFALVGQGQSIYISSLNPNAYIRFERIDSTYNNDSTYLAITKVAKPIYYGDTINSSDAKWDSTKVCLTNSSSGMLGSFYILDWISPNDGYIGVKYTTVSDTLYGWIRVNCPNPNDCYIKDYSFVGGGLGINDFKESNIIVFPNPASDKIYIALASNIKTEILLLDVYGKKVKSTQQKEMDVRDLQEGIYFVQVKTANGIIVKKMVVQR